MSKWGIAAIVAFVCGLILSFWWMTGPRDYGPLWTGGVWSVITFVIAMGTIRENSSQIDTSTMPRERAGQADFAVLFSAFVAAVVFVPFLILHIGLRL